MHMKKLLLLLILLPVQAYAWSIVSSVIEWQNPQSDGTYNVRELHTDSYGLTYTFDYILDAKTNANTHLSNDAAGLLVSLPLQEISANLNSVVTLGAGAVVTFNYSTVPQNVAALRTAFAQATQTQVIFMGAYLSTLTNLQLENAFGFTANQVTTLRANYLTPYAADATAILSATGE
jgi:hypothetical protein